MKTQELTGPGLDWAVMKAEGLESTIEPDGTLNVGNVHWRPSLNWGDGGPIIEREKITLNHGTGIGEGFRWVAATKKSTAHALGSTPLIAAMRCYVASKLGDEVDVPDELV